MVYHNHLPFSFALKLLFHKAQLECSAHASCYFSKPSRFFFKPSPIYNSRRLKFHPTPLCYFLYMKHKAQSEYNSPKIYSL